MNKSVTILSFSSRDNGNCAAVSAYLQSRYAQSIAYHVNLMPCGCCDYECLKKDKICPRLEPAQTQVMDAICQSDLVYFIVPNYCGYPCANYFSFNERSVGYFNMDRNKMEHYMSIPKRFIVISNSEGFEDAMAQQTNGQPEILYLKSAKYGKHSIAGDILKSDAARAVLDQYLSRDGL